jgi:hypothetical protein
LDYLSIIVYCGGSIVDIYRTVVPYLQDNLRRRGRSQSGLGIEISCDYNVSFRVGDVSGKVQEPVQMDGVVALTVNPHLASTPAGLLAAAAVEFISCAPPEEVVCLRVIGRLAAMGDIYTRLPNLNTLFLIMANLPEIFPEPNPDKDEVIFPSLQHLVLQKPGMNYDDWSPLINFLTGRAASGNRLSTLKITQCGYTRSNFEDTIRELVHDFEADDADSVILAC